MRQSWRRILALVLLLSGSALLVGCGDGGQADAAGRDANGGKRLRVVCTTTMIADLAHQIAGDHAEIIGIMKVGEDPHVYDVRPRDAMTISEADLVLMNGLHLESTLGDVIAQHAQGPVVALAESPAIKPRGLLNNGTGAPDPHCWFNVEYFKVYAERTRDALVAADPAHADEYERHAAAYLAELDSLHQWVASELQRIPAEQRVIVTSHDAFAYYGECYGVEVHAVIGISTEEQARAGHVRELEQLVSHRGVKALFIETSVQATLNDLVRKVAENTGAAIGGTLYSDSLGPPDSEAGTYIGMVRHNTRTIVEALSK